MKRYGPLFLGVSTWLMWFLIVIFRTSQQSLLSTSLRLGVVGLVVAGVAWVTMHYRWHAFYRVFYYGQLLGLVYLMYMSRKPFEGFQDIAMVLSWLMLQGAIVVVGLIAQIVMRFKRSS